MKKLCLLIFVICIFLSAKSQDLIIMKNGQKIENCKITKEDSLKIYFEFENKGRFISTYTEKEKIERYQYNYLLGNPETRDSLLNDEIREVGSLGFGMGLDYGGLIGVNLLFYPQNNVGIFLGGGYALAGFGFNTGIKIRLLKGRINPYLVGMYGYNTVIKVIDASQFDKFFYGPTVGFGCDLRQSKVFSGGYFTGALLIPIRSSDVYDYIDDLENNHSVEFNTPLMPFAISFGYRVRF